MATVFMKWLETTPEDYDRGIQLITLGRLRALKERIAVDVAASFQGSSLQLVEARPTAVEKAIPVERESGIGTCCLPCAVVGETASPALARASLPEMIPQLRHQVTIKTVLLDLLSLVNRFVPPCPKTATGFTGWGIQAAGVLCWLPGTTSLPCGDWCVS